MTAPVFVFEDPPPDPPSPVQLWADRLAALSADHLGQWARFDLPSDTAARSALPIITGPAPSRAGIRPNRPEVEVRDRRVYVRVIAPGPP